MPSRRKPTEDTDEEKSKPSSSRKDESEDEKVENEDIEEAPVRREQPKRKAKSSGSEPSETSTTETRAKAATTKSNGGKKASAAKKSGSTKPPRAKRAKVEKVEDDSDSNDDDSLAPGWDAITRALDGIYGEKAEPAAHYGTLIPWSLGGPDPLRGISCYFVPGGEDPSVEPPHWHYVTYGFSDLFDKENPDPRVSGFGFELTLRLKLTKEELPGALKTWKSLSSKAAKTANNMLQHVPKWPISMLQNLGRYVFNTHRTFDVGDHMNLNGPICLSTDTQIRAALFATDSRLPAQIDTKHGAVKFIQFVGITEDEYELTWEWSSAGLLDFIRSENPLLVTDLERNSLLTDERTLAAIRKNVEAEGSHLGMLFSAVMAKYTKLSPNMESDSDDDNGDAAGAIGAPAGPRKKPLVSSAMKSKRKGGFLTSRTTKSSAVTDALRNPRSTPTQGYQIKLGAMIVRQLVRVLRVRLPYGRSLSILGPKEELITFLPADGLEEDQKPTTDNSSGQDASVNGNKSNNDDEKKEDAESTKKKGASSAKEKKTTKKQQKKRKRADDDDDENSSDSDDAPAEKKEDSDNKEKPLVSKKRPDVRQNVIELSEETDNRGHIFLKVVLSNDIVRDVCSMLKPSKGTYIFGEGEGTLMFVVTPTEIKSAMGDEVVDTIGDD